jgi:flavin-dependent dehydrogenase
VKKDVAILGGGASGTYAAVRLKEDYKKSVLLIEMEPVLVVVPSDIMSNKHS